MPKNNIISQYWDNYFSVHWRENRIFFFYQELCIINNNHRFCDTHWPNIQTFCLENHKRLYSMNWKRKTDFLPIKVPAHFVISDFWESKIRRNFSTLNFSFLVSMYFARCSIIYINYHHKLPKVNKNRKTVLDSLNIFFEIHFWF